MFQSTPPMREATSIHPRKRDLEKVSIHASHAGGDIISNAETQGKLVSIHASHAGGDSTPSIVQSVSASFQSTPPMREATPRCDALRRIYDVSIHASHAGGDSKFTAQKSETIMFQSTPPMREATHRRPTMSRTSFVSIHASHAGGDYCRQ